MGFTPREVGQMTRWEFECAFNGWRKANSTEEKPTGPMPSDDELAALGILGFD